MDSSENYITFCITAARAIQIYMWRWEVSQENATRKTIEDVLYFSKNTDFSSQNSSESLENSIIVTLVTNILGKSILSVNL